MITRAGQGFGYQMLGGLNVRVAGIQLIALPNVVIQGSGTPTTPDAEVRGNHLRFMTAGFSPPTSRPHTQVQLGLEGILGSNLQVLLMHGIHKNPKGDPIAQMTPLRPAPTANDG